MKIKIQRISARAALPEYSHGPAEDAGMDLRAVDHTTLAPGIPQAVATGLTIELPPGYEAQVRPRSGLALKHAITVPNAPSTIDPGYRGEIKVILLNLVADATMNIVSVSISTAVTVTFVTPTAETVNVAVPLTVSGSGVAASVTDCGAFQFAVLKLSATCAELVASRLLTVMVAVSLPRGGVSGARRHGAGAPDSI